LINKGYEIVIGIDEAGRGPLAGPVVAAAASCKFFQTSPVPHQRNRPSLIKKGMGEVKLAQFNLIRDSKTLSEKQREKLFDFIHEHFYIGVGICDHRTIDRINILQATYLAAKKAISDLVVKMNQDTRNKNQTNPKSQSAIWRTKSKQITKIIILFDGNRKIPNLSIKQKTVPSGDKLVKSISAASIIAKVTRDRIMKDSHKKYPQYHFDKHKGYGTKLHFELLKKHGPCKIHRRSFKPVKLAPH
jgi:ribonuclease HII